MPKIITIPKLSRLLGLSLCLLYCASNIAIAAESTQVPPRQQWQSDGIFGSLDKKSAQRGLQVFSEVCAACHSLRLVSFRHLKGIGYGEEQIKAFAANYSVPAEPDENGEINERPAIPADPFPAPYANEAEARSLNNGAYPPDLSLIVKARNRGNNNFFLNLADALSGSGATSGSDYLYALLTGYETPPSDTTMQENMHYNTWFPSHQIAMPDPLSEGQVEYTDGTPATVAQMARDVTTFLAWTSEPELEKRHSMGIRVIAFLLVLLGLVIAAKRALWNRIKH